MVKLIVNIPCQENLKSKYITVRKSSSEKYVLKARITATMRKLFPLNFNFILNCYIYIIFFIRGHHSICLDNGMRMVMVIKNNSNKNKNCF